MSGIELRREAGHQ